MGSVHGNGGKMYTLLYYMRAKEGWGGWAGMGLMGRGATGIAEPDFLPGWGKSFSGQGRNLQKGMGGWETKKGTLVDLMKEYISESNATPLIFTTFCSYVIQNSYLCSLI